MSINLRKIDPFCLTPLLKTTCAVMPITPTFNALKLVRPILFIKVSKRGERNGVICSLLKSMAAPPFNSLQRHRNSIKKLRL